MNQPKTFIDKTDKQPVFGEKRRSDSKKKTVYRRKKQRIASPPTSCELPNDIRRRRRRSSSQSERKNNKTIRCEGRSGATGSNEQKRQRKTNRTPPNRMNVGDRINDDIYDRRWEKIAKKRNATQSKLHVNGEEVSQPTNDEASTVNERN